MGRFVNMNKIMSNSNLNPYMTMKIVFLKIFLR